MVVSAFWKFGIQFQELFHEADDLFFGIHLLLVGRGGLDAAVVDGELLEIGEDGDGELGAPGVPAELVGGVDVVADADGGLLGFDEEDPSAAEAEAVVRGAGGALHVQGILVDDLPEGF